METGKYVQKFLILICAIMLQVSIKRDRFIELFVIRISIFIAQVVTKLIFIIHTVIYF